MTDPRRTLPSVSALLESAGVRALLVTAPRSLVLAAVRHVVSRARDDSSFVPADEAAWT
jgi:hypothetical protein